MGKPRRSKRERDESEVVRLDCLITGEVKDNLLADREREDHVYSS